MSIKIMPKVLTDHFLDVHYYVGGRKWSGSYKNAPGHWCYQHLPGANTEEQCYAILRQSGRCCYAPD